MNKIILPVIVSLLIISLSLTNSAHAVLVQTYNNPTPKDGLQFGEGFGFSVSLDGNNLLVGAVREDTGGTNAGAAYLYDTSGNLLQTYINPIPNGDSFGFSVSLDGSNVLVGAFGTISPSTDGRAYLFDTNGNPLQTYNNPSPASDFFGISVSIDGTNVLVGAPGDDTQANSAGAAYLFDTSGNLLQTFFSPTPAASEQFGRSVSIDGNNVLVGGSGGGVIAGAAYLFDTNGNPLQTYNNPTPASNDVFGFSSSIDGNNVLVGSRDSAHLFDTSGNLLQTFNNPTPEAGDGFGTSLSIDGNNILVGAPSDDTGADGAGSAYLFNPDVLPPIVGGEFLPIDNTSLLLAGIQTSAAWLIPVVLSILGIGLFVFRKSENS